MPSFGAAAVRARKLFARYKLDSAKGVEDVLRITSQVAGRPVTVVRQDETYDNFGTALTYNFPNRSVIVLRAADHSFYRTRGFFHEIGHLIFGHAGCRVLAAGMPQPAGDDDWPRVLRTDVYALYSNDPDELEAEALAVLICRHLLKPEWYRDERIFG